MEMDCGVCWKPDWVAKLKSERALMGGSFSIWESTAMECLWDNDDIFGISGVW